MKKNLEDIRAVVCDLDGTLLNNKAKVSQKTIDTIKKLREQGILFGICTGRPAAGIQKLLKKWKIQDLCDFVLTFNGGSLVNAKGEVIEKDHDLSAQAVRKAMEELNKHHPVFCEYQGNELKTTRRNLSTLGMCHRNGLHLKKVAAKELEQETQKLMITGFPWKITKILSQENHENENYRMFRSGPFLIEILNPELSKMKGIEKLCRNFNLKPEQVLSFGNDHNDLEMLAGTRGAAMKNALEKVKETAEFVTDRSNDQDGVADFIEKYVLTGNN